MKSLSFNIIKTTWQIAVLYVISLFGEFITKTFHLFIPGSIIGFILLFLCLQWKIIKIDSISKGASFLLIMLP